MKLYFRWKLFAGFFGFAVVVSVLLLALLVSDVSRGQLLAAHPAMALELRQWLGDSLIWALVILVLVSIPPALWIASRLNRPLRLLDTAMREVARGNLEVTVPSLRTYDEFEGLIEHFNHMVTGLGELENLRAERERFVALSMDLICLAGPDGRFEEVNPAFERVLGHSKRELLTTPFLEFVHPDDVQATLLVYEELKTGAPLVSFVNRYRCADGSYRWLEWSAAPVPDRQVLFAIARDVTDRKRMEEAERALFENKLQFRVAREIQRSLLPAAAPVIEGYDIAGASHPAAELGGDYFDYLPMCHGRLGLVVSDVAGHGAGPGLVMAATRTALRTLAASDCDVTGMLGRTNQILLESTPDNCFVTLALCELDPEGRRVRYLSCGHSTGYLLDSAGGIKARLTSTAPPLGLFEDFPLEAASEHKLEPGDLLVMVTDGVVEAQSPERHLFGDKRALEVVRANQQAPAAAIVEALHRAALEFCQASSTQDDVTSLVVKVGPAA